MTAYTAAQRLAIECLNEPLQIIACAGSGKTQVISQRIANILGLPGVEPRNIIAFTFTEKAAAELKDRVLALVEEQHGEVTGMAEMFIGTMHGYCLDLVQRLVPETFKFSALTDITARLLVDRNSSKSGLTTCPTIPPAKQPHLKRYRNSKLFLQVMSVLREDDIDFDQVPAGVNEASDRYLGMLYDKAFFDFTEMINLAVQFLEDTEDNDVKADIAANLRYLVVDEYQDVNPLQERLIRALVKFGANLCVVGDDDQTIYQWRGSEVSNIISFAERYDGVRQVVLDDNFRSSEGIVELGRSIAERIPDGHRLQKKMVGAKRQKWSRGDILGLEFADPDAEAAWICDRIQRLRGMPFRDTPETDERGLSWSDMAVLYRSVAQDSGPLVDEMRRRDIPFVIKGLNRLFDAPEIKAVVGLFDYMVERIGERDLRALWESANLLPTPDLWVDAVAVLDNGRDFARGARWGVYNIQRVYLDVLEALKLREETIPGGRDRGELVFYQLGKFSQAISDFEQIYFNTEPERKYESFANWLKYQAPDYYADADADAGYATPNAVVVATVHQAKGMQWPAVFVPCMRRNRFPGKAHGGLNLFHVIPEMAIADPERYKGGLEDETRLFYVAVTRAQKYLAITFSPVEDNQLYRKRSVFFDHVCGQQWVSTRESAKETSARLEPHPQHEIAQVTLSFSELKYIFECPYQFKLRFLYGFNAPIHEALGYGKGLHDALAEVHKRAIAGDIADASEAQELVDRHLYTPFAYPELRETLRRSAVRAIVRYFDTHGEEIPYTVYSEKQIQVHIAPGITVDGRIDLVRRLDTDELAIVDFKSTDRAQAEDVTRDQLHVYAVGYEELTGEDADLVEVLNLDEEGKNTREEIDASLLNGIRRRIRKAGEQLRANDLPRLRDWGQTCDACDLAGICRDAPARRDRRDQQG